MGTKYLEISEVAYERLQAHRQDAESFSDVIIRLTDEGRDGDSGCRPASDVEPESGATSDAMEGFGTLSNVEGFPEGVESTRDDLDDDLRERPER